MFGGTAVKIKKSPFKQVGTQVERLQDSKWGFMKFKDPVFVLWNKTLQFTRAPSFGCHRNLEFDSSLLRSPSPKVLELM